MDEFKDYNIILIGLGPHAKRIYMNLFKKYTIEPKIIVDLKTKKQEVEEYLEENNFKHIDLYFIDDQEKDEESLSEKVKEELRQIMFNKNIKYAIISTEPKSHFAYAKFLLENDINILSENKMMHINRKIK